jgi:hypothetical protein
MSVFLLIWFDLILCCRIRINTKLNSIIIIYYINEDKIQEEFIMIIKGDIFTGPIDYALQKEIKEFENPENKDEAIIYESLKRSQATWENIRIHGLGIYGMTHEQFCEHCKEKRNIIFLSDDELETFNKAVEIMKIMNK